MNAVDYALMLVLLLGLAALVLAELEHRGGP